MSRPVSNSLYGFEGVDFALVQQDGSTKWVRKCVMAGCDCRQVFTKAHTWMQHRFNVTGKSQYPCAHCPHVAATSKLMFTHMRRHHKNVGGAGADDKNPAPAKVRRVESVPEPLPEADQSSTDVAGSTAVTPMPVAAPKPAPRQDCADWEAVLALKWEEAKLQHALANTRIALADMKRRFAAANAPCFDLFCSVE